MPLLRSDPELLHAFRHGRREALERVYRHYVRQIDRYTRALARASGHPELGQASAVADLVQDVFLRAFSSSGRNGYDGLREYGPYLATIARNCFVDALRARGREVLKSSDELRSLVPEDDLAEPEAWCDAKTFGVLTDYLRGLPGPLKGVYEQRFVLGLSQEETSAALGMSRRAIRTAEGKLRGGLRKALVRAGISLRDIRGLDDDFSTRTPASAVMNRSRS